MAEFLKNLFQSILTPGPTPTLVVATNASFAALQEVLFLLLVATHSVHFLILSFLCAGLWWAINWFVREVQTASTREAPARETREARRERRSPQVEDSGTETEDANTSPAPPRPHAEATGTTLKPMDTSDVLQKRRSLGDVSGTDSEWDKVENEEAET
jgi:hypothetical protein